MWLFQGVLNAGLQILLSIFGGWLCARLHLVDPDVLSRSLNVFAMRAAFPAFILHLLGIKTDLQDLEAWRALGVFVLWVVLIHLACYGWFKLRKQTDTRGLGLNCLLLSTNNTGCIGWPVLIATVGTQGAALSMLLGILFFVQLLPVAKSCFEYQQYVEEHGHSQALPEVSSASLSQDAKSITPGGTKITRQPTNGSQEVRYCYWSTAEYVSRPAAAEDKRAPDGPIMSQPPCPHCQHVAVCVPVDVAVSQENGGGSGSSDLIMPGSAGEDSNSSAAGQLKPAPAAASVAVPCEPTDVWRSHPVLKAQQSSLSQLQQDKPQLTRAKDSCDSLESSGSATVDRRLQQPLVLQSPKPPNASSSTLTRRLSKGINSVQTAAAAASSAAGVVAAALSSTPRSLARAASLRRQQQQEQQRMHGSDKEQEPLVGRTVGSFASSGAVRSPTPLPPGNTAPSAPEPTNSSADSVPGGGGGAGTAAAAARGSDPAGDSSSELSSTNGSSGEGTNGRSAAARHRASLGGAGARASPFAAMAADSVQELRELDSRGIYGSSAKQQLEQPALQASAVAGAGCLVAPAPTASDRIKCSSSFSCFSLCGRPGSRVDSKTSLLPTAVDVATKADVHGKTISSTAGRLSIMTPEGAAPGRTVGGRQRSWPAQFVSRHPLLCHITAVQLQSFHLWLNVVAITLSVSGVRRYLDPASPTALPALGWLDGALAWFSSACIPVLLFANGVWMYGKDVLGGRKGQLQVMLILSLKLLVLPGIMVGLTQLFQLSGPYGLSLVLLASCPLAPLAFLICQEYGVGAELATSVTIQGILLMLPQMMAIIKIVQVTGLYSGVELIGS